MEEPKIISETSRTVEVSDGTKRIKFKKHGLGLVTYGKIKVKSVVAQHAADLEKAGVSLSEQQVLSPISDNEGQIEAINTWDGSHLSFSFMQWTLGVKATRGELAALLKKIQQKQPAAFMDHFGSAGLGVTNATNSINGFLTLHGNTVRKSSHKNVFREWDWAFRFWRAGLDSRVQYVCLDHAISRLYRFYDTNRVKVKGRKISEYINSEYGVALILDNHVNRPAWVRTCIEEGLNRSGLAKSDPKSWTSADENKLLEKYLDVRVNYREGKLSPMTHAREREATVRDYVRAGKLSKQRHSFVR